VEVDSRKVSTWFGEVAIAKMRRYGMQEPVIIQFTANPPSGVRTGVISVVPGVCDGCRVERYAECSAVAEAKLKKGID
jgi:hypothetical protein